MIATGGLPAWCRWSRHACLFALTLSALAGLAQPASAQNRLALVIGNNLYPALPADRQLQKAVNDSRTIGDALEKIGFDVTRGENLDRRDMVDKLFAFTRKIQPGDMAVVFFAGHGVSLSGGNYLLPTDTPMPALGEETRIRNIAIGEADIVADIQDKKARVAIMLIDACRDNPFRQPGLTRSLGGTRGLQSGVQAQGVFAVYSAGFGQSALDRLGPNDSSPNSIFTRVLAPQLARAGQIHLGDLIIDIREKVAELAASVGHQQFPAYYDQTRGGRIFLAARGDVALPNAQPGIQPGTPPLVAPPPPPPVVQQPSIPPVASLPPQPRAPEPLPAGPWPERPVELVVPYAAGGTSDIVARTLAQKLSEIIGQPVVVINKAGAGGIIGARSVASARADGHTLLLGDSFSLIAARLRGDPSVGDPLKDLQPVGSIAVAGLVLVTRTDLKAKSADDLFALARQSPGKLTFASFGVGSLSHIGMQMLVDRAGVKMVHVPFRGSAEAAQSLIAGHVDAALLPAASAQSLIEAGRLTALAVAAGVRSAKLPNVPTLSEAGFSLSGTHYALFAPAQLPPATAAKIGAALERAVTQSHDTLARLDVAPTPLPAARLAEILQRQEALFRPVFAAAGIR